MSIPAASSPSPSSARLRTAGICILIIGLSLAAALYFFRSSGSDTSDDVSTPQTSKAQARAIEMQVGKMGVLLDYLTESSQDPALISGTIAFLSALTAGGCFYLSRLIARRDRQPPAPP